MEGNRNVFLRYGVYGNITGIRTNVWLAWGWDFEWNLWEWEGMGKLKSNFRTPLTPNYTACWQRRGQLAQNRHITVQWQPLNRYEKLSPVQSHQNTPGRIINPLISTLKSQSNGPLYSNAVIGTLAVDGWAVTFGTARRGLGGLGPRPVPSSLYQL